MANAQEGELVRNKAETKAAEAASRLTRASQQKAQSKTHQEKATGIWHTTPTKQSTKCKDIPENITPSNQGKRLMKRPSAVPVPSQESQEVLSPKDSPVRSQKDCSDPSSTEKTTREGAAIWWQQGHFRWAEATN